MKQISSSCSPLFDFDYRFIHIMIPLRKHFCRRIQRISVESSDAYACLLNKRNESHITFRETRNHTESFIHLFLKCKFFISRLPFVLHTSLCSVRGKVIIWSPCERKHLIQECLVINETPTYSGILNTCHSRCWLTLSALSRTRSSKWWNDTVLRPLIGLRWSDRASHTSRFQQ